MSKFPRKFLGETHKQRVKVKPSQCLACAGSGYYDHNGSPKCGACNGTGRMNGTN